MGGARGRSEAQRPCTNACNSSKHVVAAGRPCWRVSVAAHAGYAAPTTGAWIDPHAGYAAQVRPPPASERGTKQVRQAAPRHTHHTNRLTSAATWWRHLRHRTTGMRPHLDRRCGVLLKCALTESGATTCVAKDAAREKLK
jgi:hypothetical protein